MRWPPPAHSATRTSSPTRTGPPAAHTDTPIPTGPWPCGARASTTCTSTASDFFVGFIARDAARLRLVDADPDDALTMFDAAIDAFQQAGNVAQLTITLASATALFERIDRLDSAATLYAAIVRQPGSAHHVPELPDLADRLVAQARPGGLRRPRRRGRGDGSRRHGALRPARDPASARRAPRAAPAPADARPGGLSGREVDVLRLAAQGHTTREIGERLFISAKTADRHIQNLYTKIGASNRADGDALGGGARARRLTGRTNGDWGVLRMRVGWRRAKDRWCSPFQPPRRTS